MPGDAATARANLGITPDNIGAALAGYGYGGQLANLVFHTSDPTGEIWNTKADAMLASMETYTAKQIWTYDNPLAGGTALVGTLTKMGGDDTALAVLHSWYDGTTYRKTKSYGTWSEWVNVGATAFAPAGYGLGGQATWLGSSTDLDSVWRNGNYYWSNESPANAPTWTTSTYTAYSYMRVDNASSGNVTQTVYTRYSGYNNVAQTRQMVDGTWGEWEWENPPMLLGVEYRTTARWEGMSVYAQCVDCGAWADQKSIDVTISGSCYRVIRHEGLAGDYVLPFIYSKDLDGKYTAYCRVSRTTTTNINIKLCGGLDGSAATYSTKVTIYYVKS